MEPSTIAEVIQALEDGSEPSEFLGYSARVELVKVEARAQEDNQLLMGVTTREEGRLFSYYVCDSLFDVSQWIRFGRVVQNSITLQELIIQLRKTAQTDDEFITAAGQCLTAAFATAKHNKSIVRADLNLTLGLSINDLSYFIQNNEALSYLKLEYWGKSMTLENSTDLSRAIGSVLLYKLDIKFCGFESAESFEQLLGGCSSVEELSVICGGTSDCNSLTAFLRDPSNELKKLNLSFCRRRSNRNYSVGQEVRDITTSLTENTHLKKLRLSSLRDEYKPSFDSNKLLCDISSINSILSSSNHTIERLDVSGGLPFLALQCLKLNRNEDKDEVKHKKIFAFYFVGKFDVSPFLTMPVSVLPEVMSQIEGRNKLSAIHRFLCCIPDLCNVSDRVSKPTESKRQKIKHHSNQTSPSLETRCPV